MYTVEQNDMTGWDVVDSTGYSISERSSEADARRIADALNKCAEGGPVDKAREALNTALVDGRFVLQSSLEEIGDALAALGGEVGQ